MPCVLTPAQQAEFDEKGFTYARGLVAGDGNDEHFTSKPYVPDVRKAA